MHLGDVRALSFYKENENQETEKNFRKISKLLKLTIVEMNQKKSKSNDECINKTKLIKRYSTFSNFH